MRSTGSPRGPLSGWRMGIAIAAVILAAMVIAWLIESPDVLESAKKGPAEMLPPDRSTAGPLEPVATGGEFGGPPASTLGTVISDMEAIGGLDDLTGLIGAKVRLSVETGQAVNDVAFWTGDPPNELLVVINRGIRSSIERQTGAPSRSELGAPPPGVITIEGTIEPVPYPEATYSWGLTGRDVDVLANRGVYVRASTVVSPAPNLPDERFTAEELDETARETAPPPGEQVETPLNLPAPRP